MMLATLDPSTWSELWRTLTLQGGFNVIVVTLGTTLLGIGAGVCGTFALLRKRALMGDALAHATLPGIALAFIIAAAMGHERKSLPILLVGAAVTGVLGVLTIHGLSRFTRLREDTSIGVVLSVFFGGGIMLMSLIQEMATGTQAGLPTFIYGQPAAMGLSDTVLLAALAGGAAVMALLFFKEFRLVCFDEGFAGVQGWPVGRLDLMMMSLLVTVTVAGLQSVGLLLVIAMLIIPAAAARFWTDRLSMMTWLSAAIGGLSGYAGACASAMLEHLPAGGVIVLTAGGVFLFSLFFAPRRGVLAVGLRRMALRYRIARQHLLRAMYEHIEAGESEPRASVAIAWDRLVANYPGSLIMLRLLVLLLKRQQMVAVTGVNITLTDAGWREACAITRNHRLWEAYLMEYADFPASHVDRSADLVEHVLSPEIVAGLEQALRARDRLPVTEGLPASVHAIHVSSPGEAAR